MTFLLPPEKVEGIDISAAEQQAIFDFAFREFTRSVTDRRRFQRREDDRRSGGEFKGTECRKCERRKFDRRKNENDIRIDQLTRRYLSFVSNIRVNSLDLPV